MISGTAASVALGAAGVGLAACVGAAETAGSVVPSFAASLPDPQPTTDAAASARPRVARHIGDDRTRLRRASGGGPPAGRHNCVQNLTGSRNDGTLGAVDPQQLGHQLKERSLRVTGPRLAVLTEIHDHPHADVDTLVRAVRQRLGAISTQAVYDVLRVLTAHRLVRRIEPAGSPARFEARVGDNHHHLVCRSCRAIVDVDCVVGAAPCLTPVDDHGFAIDEAEVTIWGQCPARQANGVVPPDPHQTVITKEHQP